MKTFEIGVVYKSARDFCVAFASNALLTFRKGKPSVIRPRMHAKVVHTSVEELCSRWNVTLEELDAVLAEKFPKPTTKRTTARGSRRVAHERDEAYRLARSVRISRR